MPRKFLANACRCGCRPVPAVGLPKWLGVRPPVSALTGCEPRPTRAIIRRYTEGRSALRGCAGQPPPRCRMTARARRRIVTNEARICNGSDVNDGCGTDSVRLAGKASPYPAETLPTRQEDRVHTVPPEPGEAPRPRWRCSIPDGYAEIGTRVPRDCGPAPAAAAYGRSPTGPRHDRETWVSRQSKLPGSAA